MKMNVKDFDTREALGNSIHRDTSDDDTSI